MIRKNLSRRKGRTILTILGISIGVAAIVGLGTLANGLEEGYSSILAGSKSDLVLSQPNAIDLSYSSVSQNVEAQLDNLPEVEAYSGMIQSFVQADGIPFFFVYGYPTDSFILGRFQMIDGVSIDSREAERARGKPLVLGSAAAESLEKTTGDTIRLVDSVYRIVGVYETGDPFEDSGAVLRLSDAQELIGKPRQVSLYYIQLKEPEMEARFRERAVRLWSDLEVSSTDEFADKQLLGDILQGYVWGIAGLAIVIGGVGMMNTQLMSVFERTREIGVLRALGWSSRRVMLMILSESVLLGILGGVLGVFLAILMLLSVSGSASVFGISVADISGGLLFRAFMTVVILGLIGGIYPARRASKMQPIEALRYEGGTASGKVRRLPIGGMAVQSLVQRTGRTGLTVGAIAITVGAIMALEGILVGVADSFTQMAIGAGVEIMVRQADIADTSLSAIDERTGDRIAALPEVDNISGMVFAAVSSPESGFILLQGFSPNEYAIRRFQIVEGQQIEGNRQIMLGTVIAEALGVGVGETVDFGGPRFKVVGLYETGIGYEDSGGVVSLRDAQSLIGRPRKVTMYAVKVNDPVGAEAIVARINESLPTVHAALSGEFVEQLPDMQNSDAFFNAISFLAILVGGVGVLNTMLMAVLERTREIGVLRTMGWRRGSILTLILKEALLLGLIGGVIGIFLAFILVFLMGSIPMVGGFLEAIWSVEIFVRAMLIAVALGLVGGFYPAYRATRLEPVEALRYE